MAFVLINDPDTTVYEKVTINIEGQGNVAKGELLILDRTANSYLTVKPKIGGSAATNTALTANICGVAVEALTSGTSVLVAIITSRQTWQAASTNNGDATYNGQRMYLSTAAPSTAINNSGTDVTTGSGVFMQTGISGATTDKLILGKFLKGFAAD